MCRAAVAATLLYTPSSERRRSSAAISCEAGWLAAALLALSFGLLAMPAIADEPAAVEQPAEAEDAEGKPEPGILFIADTLIYDSKARVVNASGHVQAWRSGRTIVADEVRYDEAADRVTAKGNITLFEATGEIVFADEMELTGDLKEGVIDNVRAILADGARLAAANGERSGGNVTKAHRAVYSPCESCPDDPDRPLIWQVKAVKVVHDQKDKIIEFYQAQLEIADVPVLWIPYFYAPDPTVKRKSGFLIPTFGSSSELGFLTRIPYFWAISPNEDATITPWFMTQEGVLLQGQYRRAYADGSPG
jgi:LPS-assembly protein